MAEPKKQLDNQEDLSHDTKYYTAKPLDERTKLKMAIEEKKKSIEKKTYLLSYLGIFLIVLAIILAFIFLYNSGKDCKGLSCAFNGIGVIAISVVAFVLVLVSIFATTKAKDNRTSDSYPALTILRWFFAIVLALSGAVMLIFGNLSAVLCFCGIILLVISLILMFWNKIKNRFGK